MDRSRLPEPPARRIVDFTDPREPGRWRAMDDVVMGGVSQSRLERTPEGTCVFTGTVSLANGGGFASVRSADGDYRLGGASVLSLRHRGDGKTYRLHLRTSVRVDAVSYQAEFATSPGVWQETSFQVADFVPMWRGRVVRDAPPLQGAAVTSLGLLIADAQEGPFRLELASLSAR